MKLAKIQLANNYYPDNYENRLLHYMAERDIDGCKATIAHLSGFLKENSVDPIIISTFISTVNNYIYRALIKNGIIPTILFGKGCWDTVKNNNISGDYDESLNALMYEIGLFIETIKESNSNNDLANSNIRKAVEIIEEEYSNPGMSIEFVARRIYLNVNYFSQLFKKEMGMTFLEYLNNIRIKKAKILLKKEEIKIMDISNTLGISNSHYFGIWFKEKTGLTPS